MYDVPCLFNLIEEGTKKLNSGNVGITGACQLVGLTME